MIPDDKGETIRTMFAHLSITSEAFPGDHRTHDKQAAEIRAALGQHKGVGLGLTEADHLGCTLDPARAALARQGLYLRRTPSSLRRDMEWVFLGVAPLRGPERRPYTRRHL